MATMKIRMMQTRLAVSLFAAGIFLLTAASAWAFSRENVLPDGGNYSFGDPDKQPTTLDNHTSSQSARPFGSSGPVVQFGVQQGPLTTFGQGNRYNTPDPYFRSLTNGN
jgi:hypothetical protein